MKRIPLLSLFFIAIYTIGYSQIPGSMDPTFNKTGLFDFSLKENRTEDYASISYLQPDGKLIVACEYLAQSGRESFIVRLLPNGGRDQSFGNNGKVLLSELELSSFIVKAIALSSNGNIVLAGQSFIEGPRAAIACLNSAGELDKTFYGIGHRIFYDIEGESPCFNTVNIHASTGNIIACGQTDEYGNYNNSMLVVGVDKFGDYVFEENHNISRIGGMSSSITCAVQFHNDSLYVGLNQYGNDDFNIMGVAAVSMTTGLFNEYFGAEEEVKLLPSSSFDQTFCTSIALTASKDILIGGYAFDGSASQFLVHKIKAATEETDIQFGNNGEQVIEIDPLATEQRASTLIVDNNNFIVVGGYCLNNTNRHWALTRLTTNGQVDANFGIKKYSEYNHTTYSGISSVHALSSGDYFLTGTYLQNANTDVAVKKINASGNSVTTYGKNSLATVWAQDYNTNGYDMLIRSDGKLWLCGEVNMTSVIALVNPNGTFDQSFGGQGNALPGTFIIPTTLYNDFKAKSISWQGSKLLVAGTYNSGLDEDILLVRLTLVNNNLVVDNSFGINGYTTFDTEGKDVVQGMTVQANGKVLVYGYFGPGETISVIRFNEDGIVDSGFGDGGIIYYGAAIISNPDDGKSIDLKLIPNTNKTVLVTSIFSQQSSNILVLILNDDGTIDKTESFDYAGDGFTQDIGFTVAVNSQNIFVGGSINDKFAIVCFKHDLTLNTSFGNGGVATSSKEYQHQEIKTLHFDGQRLVAIARCYNPATPELIAALRYTLEGKLDNTFLGKGFSILGEGKPYNSYVAGNRLYCIGSYTSTLIENHVTGRVIKMALGNGPVIKTATLSMPNLVKTYGDQPFKIKTVANSPAPITYTIINTYATCATVNSEGVFTIRCATLDEPVIVKAYQPAINGYTEATAYSTIHINKAVPKIVFPRQGGVIGDTITLKITSNTNSQDYYFTMLTSNAVAEFVNSDKMVILAEGEEQVLVTYYSTDNFVGDTIRTVIYGFQNPIAPEANNDIAELIYGQNPSIIFNVLENDVAYTGFLDAKHIDLDLSQEGFQNTYVSPSLGLFVADTNGFVTYTPFSGFIGSGEIEYTIRDSRGSQSQPASIKVSVQIQSEAPALKATELVTPNNDGLNDAFVIGYVNLENENRLTVFDRNGAELFTKENYKNDWKGELANGKMAENGFYYFLFIERGSGNNREIKGMVELRR